MAVFKQPQSVVACEVMSWCENRVVAVKGNDHNEFGNCGNCGNYTEYSEGFGLKVTCNLCVRKNWIDFEYVQNLVRNKKLKKMVSLSNSRLNSSWRWDRRCGRGAWPSSRTSSPQKCPSSRRWCQLFFLRFMCWAWRKVYLSGCMLAVNSQLLTTASSRHTMWPQVHCLFGQPEW